jgi:phytoene dehydrogenase-like protein/glycine cleavage system aminomethyltransferase T
MTDRYDAIVVGAGHNGLVCSALLAKAGKKVLVLEANERVGGAAVTREFADGFSVSACAHLLYQLQPKVRKELGLSPKLASEAMQTIALSSDGQHVRYSGDMVKGVADADVRSYRAFHRQMTRFADLLNTYLNTTPPRLGTGNFRDLATLARLGFDLRRLGRAEMRTFLRLIGINIHDEVTERFENPLLRGALSFDAVLGTHLGPRSPNTIMTYLYRLAAGHGRLAVPTGGMGALAEELAHAARGSGVTIRTNMPVKRIVIENGRVAGVEAAGGERFESLTVVSNADPKRTILELVGTRHVETGFTRRINNIRMRGNAAKLHLALDGLPTIEGVAKNEFGDRLVIAPDEHYVERAFNPAKYGESSAEPVIEMTFPSFRDPALAPTGKHVMSCIVQYAPYALRGGWTEAARGAFTKTCIETIGRYAPDLGSRITASELLTPADIEPRHSTGCRWTGYTFAVRARTRAAASAVLPEGMRRSTFSGSSQRERSGSTTGPAADALLFTPRGARHAQCLAHVEGLHGAGCPLLRRHGIFRDSQLDGRGPGRVAYAVWCNDQGQVIDDGTIFHLRDGEYRLCSQERHCAWLMDSAIGLDVSIVDETADVAALAVQGPTSFAILSRMGIKGLGELKPFGLMHVDFDGFELTVSRTGFTGDLGYELWTAPENAETLWDYLFAAGEITGIRAIGTDALEHARIEAGYIMAYIDFLPANATVRTGRTRSPLELGLDWLVDFKKPNFNGRRALAEEKRNGSTWRLVKLDIEGNKPAHHAYIFADQKGKQNIGFVTSAAWSPVCKQNIALGTVRMPHGAPGTNLWVEVFYQREMHWSRVMARAEVVDKPFWFPKRRSLTPPDLV